VPGDHESQGVTDKPVILWVSYVATGSMALLLISSGVTFAKGDASILGLRNFDASWLYYVAGVIGLGSIAWRKLRVPWLWALTVCTLGRGVSLLVVGSPVISDRGTEIRAAIAWFTLWVLGSAPTIYAQASDLLRGRLKV
jgi:hypothetical protein